MIISVWKRNGKGKVDGWVGKIQEVGARATVKCVRDS